jgi:hypothetical protein
MENKVSETGKLQLGGMRQGCTCHCNPRATELAQCDVQDQNGSATILTDVRDVSADT